MEDLIRSGAGATVYDSNRLTIYMDPNAGDPPKYDRIQPLLYFANRVVLYGPLLGELKSRGVTFSDFRWWLSRGWVHIVAYEDFLDPLSRASKTWEPLTEWSDLDRLISDQIGTNVSVIPTARRDENKRLAVDIAQSNSALLRVLLANRNLLPARYRQRPENAVEFANEASEIVYDFLNDITVASSTGTFIPYAPYQTWGSLYTALASLLPDGDNLRQLWGLSAVADKEDQTAAHWDPHNEMNEMSSFLDELAGKEVGNLDTWRDETVLGRTGDQWLRRRIQRMAARLRSNISAGHKESQDIDPLISSYKSLTKDSEDLRKQAADWYASKSSKIPRILADVIVGAIFGFLISPQVPVVTATFFSVITDRFISGTSPKLRDMLIQTKGYFEGNYHVYLHEMNRQ